MFNGKILFLFFLVISLSPCVNGVTSGLDPNDFYADELINGSASDKRVTVNGTGINKEMTEIIDDKTVQIVLHILFYAAFPLVYISFIWLCCITCCSTKRVKCKPGKDIHGLPDVVSKK